MRYVRRQVDRMLRAAMDINAESSTRRKVYVRRVRLRNRLGAEQQTTLGGEIRSDFLVCHPIPFQDDRVGRERVDPLLRPRSIELRLPDFVKRNNVRRPFERAAKR